MKRRYWLVLVILALIGYLSYRSSKDWERQWGIEGDGDFD